MHMRQEIFQNETVHRKQLKGNESYTNQKVFLQTIEHIFKQVQADWNVYNMKQWYNQVHIKWLN